MVTDNSMPCIIEAKSGDTLNIWAVFDTMRNKYFCSNWKNKSKWYDYGGNPMSMNWKSPRVICKGLDQW